MRTVFHGKRFFRPGRTLAATLAAVALGACGSPAGRSDASAQGAAASSLVVTSTTSAVPAAASGSSTEPVAISFSGATQGLLLVRSCSKSTCTAWVQITSDGGKAWNPTPAFVTYPATDYIKVRGVEIENPAPDPNRFGVDALVTGSAGNGWAYGPGLFVTHDGGQQFSREKVSADVIGVAAVGGQVWVLEQRCFLIKHPNYTTTGCARSILLTGPEGGDSLKPVADQPPGFVLAAGYEPGVQFPAEIVGAGSGLDVLAGVFGLDTTTNGGRTWQLARYPCRAPYISAGWTPGSVAIDPSGSLWTICGGMFGNPYPGMQPKELWRSSDAGRSWVGPTQLASLGYADSVAAVSATTAWSYGDRAPLYHSTDGGHTWTTMLTKVFNWGTGGPRGFSAVGPEDAWAVTSQGEDTSVLLEVFGTTDGGRTWFSVSFNPGSSGSSRGLAF